MYSGNGIQTDGPATEKARRAMGRYFDWLTRTLLELWLSRDCMLAPYMLYPCVCLSVLLCVRPWQVVSFIKMAKQITTQTTPHDGLETSFLISKDLDEIPMEGGAAPNVLG